MVDFAVFTSALAVELKRQPATAFDALYTLTADLLDVKVFTVQTNDPVTGVANRLYSSVPDVYPIGGLKPADETVWSRIVLGEHRTFIANNLREIAVVFPDYSTIEQLGCASIINIPIVIDNQVWGTLNCLQVADHWTAARIAASEALKLPGTACFLLHHLIAAGRS